MALIENDLFEGKIDKVSIAIERLKYFEPPEGYYVAFSGGKDSIVIKKLCQLANVKHEVCFSVTTIDPPDLIYYIRKYHPDVKWEHPEIPLLREMLKRGFPSRRSRWCCEVYKERGGAGRTVVTGVRWAESVKRSKRKMFENCMRGPSKKFLHVIIDWSEQDVWEFIDKYKLPYCKLYDEGWKRIGCLMCPMAGQHARIREANRYPRYKQAFIRAFEELYQKRKKEGRKSVNRWESGEEMFNYWISEQKGLSVDQSVMFE